MLIVLETMEDITIAPTLLIQGKTDSVIYWWSSNKHVYFMKISIWSHLLDTLMFFELKPYFMAVKLQFNILLPLLV